MDIELIKLYAKIELARRYFWDYCKLIAPDFYTDDKEYLKDLCNRLQSFYFDDTKTKLCINLPPRHGKSRTATLFVQWVLGVNKSEKIMTGSYNETLSTTFSKAVRNAIQTGKADKYTVVYSDIFPETKIKYGDGASGLWGLEGNSTNSYLATSPTGTATGFGTSCLIIDDVIKNALEANNENVLNSHWEWFANTMMSRLEGKRKVIIIMTRWATGDLAGKFIEHFKDVEIVTYKAEENGKMLCDSVLNKEQFEDLKTTMGKDIVAANYQQEPIDIKGRLYTELLTYKEVPNFSQIRSYTDTADQGSDYLCSIVYGIGLKDKLNYILDVIYTQDGMELTEPLVAERLYSYNVNIADIESNNGGLGFSRSINNHLKDLGNRITKVKPFTQSKNKQARILTGATGVMNTIRFPEDWNILYPDFYRDVTKYQRMGKNAHDDAVDTLTGIFEMTSEKKNVWATANIRI